MYEDNQEDMLDLPEVIDDSPIIVKSTELATIKEDDLPQEWGIDTTAKKTSIKRALANKRTKHGIFTAIPMICRKDECPFKDFCTPYKNGEVERGDRCVKEIAEIIESAETYYAEFGVDPHNPNSRVDVTQISHLISTEVLMHRCEMLLAKGDLVELVETAIDPRSGEAVVQPQLHKAAEALPKFQRKHSDILRDLNATRKEKLASSAGSGMSIADYNKDILAAAAMAKARVDALRKGNYEVSEEAIEGEYTDGEDHE